MRRSIRLQPRFVEVIPDVIEPGLLYVSMRFRTASHLCPTGCGEEVVTPLDRDEWILTFDGTVTLRPSIGNPGLPCQSHYWITRNEVVWARPLSWEGAVGQALDSEGATGIAGWVKRLRSWMRR